MADNQKYSVTRLHIQTFKNKPKKQLQDVRCRYLAKSQVIKAKADNSKVEFVNFRGSKFKKVSFVNATLFGNDFWGASFNDCNFSNSTISNTIFVACRFRNCSFKNATLKNVIFVNTDLSECTYLNLDGSKLFKVYPKVDLIPELVATIESLKNNKHLKKNKLLHLNKNRVNHLNIYLLLRLFSQNQLNTLLSKVATKSFKNITTYKKLEMELLAISRGGTI